MVNAASKLPTLVKLIDLSVIKHIMYFLASNFMQPEKSLIDNVHEEGLKLFHIIISSVVTIVISVYNGKKLLYTICNILHINCITLKIVSIVLCISL